MTRSSLPPAEEAEKGKRPSGTTVVCDYELATSENTCVAQVGDGGSGTPVTPTGAVTFTTTSGGFTSGAKCTLTPTPFSAQVASCSIVYETAFSGLPSITASYSGDANHSPSTGHTQLFGAGPEESSVLEGASSPGEFSGALTLETIVPVANSTVEAALDGHDPRAMPAPVRLPAVEAALDPTSATDLRLTEALATEVDLTGAQNPAGVAAMDESLQKLTDRAAELLQGPSPAEQAEGQKLMKQVGEATEAISKMLKQQSEYTIDAATGTKAAEAADQHIETTIEQAARLLQSPTPADQLKGQQLMEEARRSFDAFTKVLQRQGELSKETLKGTHASVASRRRGTRVRTVRTKSPGRVVVHVGAAGRLKISLHVDRRALARLAHGRSSLAAILHLNMVLPSRSLKGGLPRAFVERLTLERAAGHARHGHRKG